MFYTIRYYLKINKVILFFFILTNNISFTLYAIEVVKNDKNEKQEVIDNTLQAYAKERIDIGKSEFSNKNYCSAFQNYKIAIDSLENSKVKFDSLYQDVLYSLNKIAIILILKFIVLHQNKNAECIKKIIESKEYYFDYPPKNFLLESLKKISNKEGKKRFKTNDVESLLLMGIDFYGIGKFDLANRKFNEVLNIDPYNQAAQIGLNIIKKENEENVFANKNQTIGLMASSIDHSWNFPLSNNIIQQKNNQINALTLERSNQDIVNKIHRIIIPKVEFIDTPLQSALDEIKDQSIKLDTEESDNAKRGINIVLALDLANLSPEPKITLSLTDTPLEEVIKYIVQQANLQMRIEQYAIAIIDNNEPIEPFSIQEYKISSRIFTYFNTDITNHELKKEKSMLSDSECIRNILTSQGVTFPKGSNLHYLHSKNILIVRNTISNLKLIESLLQGSFTKPEEQIEIETRFLEIKHDDLKERGINWLLGIFQLGCHLKKENFSNELKNYTAPSQVTSLAITSQSLEMLLYGAPASATIGTLTLAGILTNPQFQIIINAINQHKEVDLISAPKITVSSGKKATIRVAREFPYPSDYSPPQIPQSQGTGINPAIPTTPSSFKKRDVGVQLEVEPTINSNNNSIELKLSPQIVEFQGFVNYGNPIYSQAPVFFAGQTNLITSTASVLLTENTINQPIFSVREVDTQIVLKDGQTVLLGGLMREDIKTTKEKIPLISSIPLAGQLFHSTSEHKIKRNLLIFVTVYFLNLSKKDSNRNE